MGVNKSKQKTTKATVTRRKRVKSITTIRAGDPGAGNDFWYAVLNGTANGAFVTEDGAMRLSAVYACVRVLAESLAGLPPIVYRTTGPKSKERAPDLPIYDVLHDQPNATQTAFEFWEMATGHLCLRGNFYALIRPGRRGAVDALDPIHPDRVTIDRTTSGMLRYTVRNWDGSNLLYNQDEIFHIRGLSFDGIKGVSPITYMARVFQSAQDTESYGSGVFRHKAVPGGVLEHPGKLSAEGRKNLRDSWQSAHSGIDNAHKVAVLEEGLKWQAMGLSNEDAQFLETRKFQRSEIASVFRVPPHLIGDLEKATFSNIEQQSLDFTIHTMLPWCRRIEAAVKRDLITEPGVFLQFLIDGLLRGDIQSRYVAFGQAIRDGWLTRNEVRTLENLNPLDGLDDPLLPLNMSSQGSSGPATDNEEQDSVDDDTDQNDDRIETESVASSVVVNVSSTCPDLSPLIKDVAERIVSIEVRQLEKRIDKSLEDPERFALWLADMKQNHASVVTRILSPLFKATGTDDPKCVNVIVDGLDVVDGPKSFEQFRIVRLANIENTIMGVISHVGMCSVN